MSHFDLAVFGGRGGGETVAEYARSCGPDGPRVVGFLNDVLARGEIIGGLPVIGPFWAWRTLPDTVQFIAPLHKVKEMQARAATIHSLGIADKRWACVFDPRAAIASTTEIGVGVAVGAFCSIEVGAHIGRHVSARTGSYVSHDVTVDDFCFIGARAVLNGHVTLKEGAHIAPGALIKEYVTIGRYAVVGLGAVVTKDVPDFTIVSGYPARRVGMVADLSLTR